MTDKKKHGSFSLLRFLIMTLACGVFLFSGYQLFMHWYEDRQSQQGQQAMIDQAVVVIQPTEHRDPVAEATGGNPSAETTDPGETLAEGPPIFVDFEVLKQENPDIVAWIYSENTVINYPVVQGSDNQFYVTRMPDGRYNSNGSIFLDFRNLSDFADFNSIIYGHNMTNDSMFGTLENYKNPDYYAEHPYLWIITPDAAYRVDLIAGMVTPSDSEAYDLYNSKDELHERLRYAISKSTFDPGEVDVDSIRHVVTLSTCSYEYAIARYVVIGNLVPVKYPVNPASMSVEP